MQAHQGMSKLICNTSSRLWIRPLGDQPPSPISVKAGSAEVAVETTSEIASTEVGDGGAGISVKSFKE